MIPQIVFALVISVFAAWGLWLSMRPTAEKPKRWRRAILFYTNLSNLLMLVYHLLLAVSLLLELPLQKFLLNPTVQMSVALCIMVTFLIFHFMLRGLLVLSPGQSELLHYVVPLLVQAEWLLLAEKASLTFASALLWLSLPFAYLVLVCLHAALAGPIMYTESPWPYPFMDLDKLGFGRWLRNVVLMLAAFVLLGMVYVFLGRLISSL